MQTNAVLRCINISCTVFQLHIIEAASSPREYKCDINRISPGNTSHDSDKVTVYSTWGRAVNE